MYTEEKNVAKDFLRLHADEQAIVDVLKEVKNYEYSHSERWSLVFDVMNESFPDWRNVTTGLVYLVEDEELEEVLSELKDGVSNEATNQRLRMTVELEVDNETLKEKGVSLDDVVKGIRFNYHDVVDGFEITTDVPGCDCSTDFFFCEGKVIEIEKVGEQQKSLEEKLVNATERTSNQKASDKLRLLGMVEDLIDYIDTQNYGDTNVTDEFLASLDISRAELRKMYSGDELSM